MSEYYESGPHPPSPPAPRLQLLNICQDTLLRAEIWESEPLTLWSLVTLYLSRCYKAVLPLKIIPQKVCVEKILKTGTPISSYLLALLLSPVSPYHLLGPKK